MQIKTIICFVIISIWIDSTSAQTPSFGKCRTVSGMANLDVDQHVGVWYSYEQSPILFSLFAKCISLDITNNNGVLAVNQKQTNILGMAMTIPGTATVVSSGYYIYKLTYMPFLPMYMWTLSTDYTNYSVEYLCFEIGPMRFETVWVLTRSKTPTQSTIDTAHGILTTNSIPMDNLKKIDQSCA